MKFDLQVRTDGDGGSCYDNSCPTRFAVRGPQGGYVVRGRLLESEMARDLVAQHGAPADGEIDVWVPSPIIEARTSDAHH
jgi:hypothetical protein